MKEENEMGKRRKGWGDMSVNKKEDNFSTYKNKLT